VYKIKNKIPKLLKLATQKPYTMYFVDNFITQFQKKDDN